MKRHTASQSPGSALESAIDYLARTQHGSGSWTDFWLQVGTSDAWVTAYTGVALHAASRSIALNERTRIKAAVCADRAAEWLLGPGRKGRGWGYNKNSSPDADTTAYAIMLLSRRGMAIPVGAVDFLLEHRVAGLGFRTYAFGDAAHRWTNPCSDVTATSLLALFDAGAIDGEGLRSAWNELLSPAQQEDGCWQGYWWLTPNYTTAMALEAWQASGRPATRFPPGKDLPIAGTFDLAWATICHAHRGDVPGAERLSKTLLATQEADGGWISAPILKVPPAHVFDLGVECVSRDARRIFTTASALKALVLAPVIAPRGLKDNSASFTGCRAERSSMVRSGTGLSLDTLVGRAACVLGLGGQDPHEAIRLFRMLTRRSLAHPSPWPSVQLSSLSVGNPLEFSVAPGSRLSLRYTAEVGDPHLPPYERAASGIADVAAAAEYLGYGAAWQKASRGLARLVSHDLPVPDGTRFWVWAGIEQATSGQNVSGGRPLLKVYVNLFDGEIDGGRARMDAALDAMGVSRSPQLATVCDILGRHGILNELGFGLGPNGMVSYKVYYELNGWRRQLVKEIAEVCGMDHDIKAITPEIPGIMLEFLAAKSRAGIALRPDPATGAINELTMAAPFPVPMLSPAETVRRVNTWLLSQGWDSRPYQNMAGLLLPGWETFEGYGKMHSLFTRTVSATGPRSAIYLRPYIPE